MTLDFCKFKRTVLNSKVEAAPKLTSKIEAVPVKPVTNRITRNCYSGIFNSPYSCMTGYHYQKDKTNENNNNSNI